MFSVKLWSMNILTFDYSTKTFFPVGYILLNSKLEEAY